MCCLVQRTILSLAIVSLVGCASTKPRPVFEPRESAAVFPYYVGGIPYAQVTLDCAELICSMNPTSLGDATYLAVYLWFANLSTEPHLIHPLQDVAVRISNSEETSDYQPPTSPTKILASIKNARAAAMVAQAFAGALQAATVRPTTVTGPGGRWRIDDTDLKVQAVADRTAAAIEATALSGKALEASIDAKILRRNTVFPGETVGGFLYFRLPYDRTFGSDPEAEAERSSYTLRIRTPCEEREIEFNPVPGE